MLDLFRLNSSTDKEDEQQIHRAYGTNGAFSGVVLRYPFVRPPSDRDRGNVKCMFADKNIYKCLP